MKIIFENDDFLIVDKPAGLVVHPSETTALSDTLLDKVLDKIDVDSFKEMSDKNFRPGIVHRLDKDTSGLLVIAKNKKSYLNLVEQFKSRKVEKRYFALVKGLLEFKEGVIDSPIGRSLRNRKKFDVVSESEGKSAITQYKVTEEFLSDKKTTASLLDIELKTGRTHQIRVHMAAIGHPVVGDCVYGARTINKKFKEEFGLERQFLHAYSIRFKDLTGKKVKFESDLTGDLKKIITCLKI